MTRLTSIQALRGVAALAVVIHHVALAAGYSPMFDIGAVGVDIFFVISGFIMVYTCRDQVGQPGFSYRFLIRRLLRIVPLYWTLTTIMLAASFVMGGRASTYPPFVFLASYLFIAVPRPDGVIQPLVVVGWTLNLEVAFYALFALAVGILGRVGIHALCVVLAGAALAGQLIEPASPVVAFYLSTILLNFVGGMVIGLAFDRGTRLGPVVGGALMLAGAAALLAQIGGPIPMPVPRVLLWMVPSVALVAAAALAFPHRSGWITGLLGRLGDISYSLYLVHLIPLWACRQAFELIGLPATTAPLAFAAVAITASIVGAVVTYRLIERPFARWLGGLSAGPRRALSAA